MTGSVCGPQSPVSSHMTTLPIPGVNFHCEKWGKFSLGDFEVFLRLLLMGHLTCLCGSSAPCCCLCGSRLLKTFRVLSKLGRPMGLILGLDGGLGEPGL